MVIRDILRTKGSDVYSIGPDATLREAAQKMMEYRCGSLVVLDGEELCGIITERDLLRACADGLPLDDVRVAARMTGQLVTGDPEDELKTVMGVLTNRRVRHLPIVNDKKLSGMISIGDVVKAQYHELEFENHVLKSYLHS